MHNFAVGKIVQYLKMFLDYTCLDVETKVQAPGDIPGCEKSGVCNALVIKYAFNVLRGIPFTDEDIITIRRFMYVVENSYQLPPGEPDIEYQWSGPQIIGTIGGGLLGAGLGSFYGWPGILIGAGLGSIGGYAIGSFID